MKKVQWHMKQVDSCRLQKGWLTVDTAQRHTDSMADDIALDEMVGIDLTGKSQLAHPQEKQMLQRSRMHSDAENASLLSSTDDIWDKELISPRQRYHAAPEQPVVTIGHIKGELSVF